MQITASMVKELRERTGSGMMECKRALTETGGDVEAAVEQMRKSGLAKVGKRAGKVAAEGVISIAADSQSALIVEVNSETDFVSKGDDFVAFANGVANSALAGKAADLEALQGLPYDGGSETVDAVRQTLAAKIGENIGVRRFGLLGGSDTSIASYQHGTRIGVVVEFTGGDETVGRDVAMHIAASNPVCVAEKDVSPELLAQERNIFSAQAKESGKPDNIIEKMVEGRIRKYLAEVTLNGQAFVKNPDQSVGQLLKEHGAEVLRFIRFEVGEGIEKKVENFADEVMNQVKGN